MANIPGATNILPSVVTEIVTQSRGVSIPGGSRIAALIGEGSTDEVLVSQANGGGKDGLNSTYTSTSGSDGRHFRLQNYPLISNRTTLFKNGVPLTGTESTIDGNTFSNSYDYRIDISTGKIELQRAHLVDQGGAYYVPVSTNVGDGYISSLTLLDVNAPPETWTVRCVSVQRNGLNQPIQGTAKFIAIGSISGAKLDGNGNPIIWKADNVVVSNTILSFSIAETLVGPTAVSAFREGDAFTIKVASGVLVRGDSLTANMIPSLNLNDPVLLQGMDDVMKRHGTPSVDNNLSLGAQLAFDNGAPALLTVQAAPPLPRRVSYTLSSAVNSTSTNDDDFIFPLPAGVTPDFNSNIHFFVTNNTTNVESQILPNKLDYYLLDTAGYPTTNAFIQSSTTWDFYYTVKESFAIMATGFDGYIARDGSSTTDGIFSSSIAFDSNYVGKTLKIIDAANTANSGSYTINSVSNGKLYATHATFTAFTGETGISFQVVNALTGAVLGSAADGYLVALTAPNGTFGSTTFDFSTISSLTTRRLKINGSTAGNSGLYDITAWDSGTNTVTITKTVVHESAMRFEVLNSDETSKYIVINKSVVPDGDGLRITIIDSREASFYDAGWSAALTSLEAVECDILCPLPKQTISVIFQNALTHCLTMSNNRNKKERVLFIGAINGLTPDNLSGTTAAAVENIGILEGIQGETVTDILAGNIEDLANYSVADAFGTTYRCVYFYPDQIVVQAGTETALIDGIYIAPAAAGYLSRQIQIQEPLTNKVLSGFTILRNKQFSTFTLEQLAAAGVTTLQPVSGGGRVVWGITTTQSGYPEEQEISIVFIRDRIAKSLRAGFAGYIGTAELPETQAILNTRAIQLLNSLASQGLLTAYKDLVVKRDDVLPTQWNISVRVQPTYPINFIYIKVSVGQL